MPLWPVGERFRGSVTTSGKARAQRALLPAYAGAKGASVIKLPTPPGLLLRRLAPTPPVHVEEHRVVVAEEHLPK